MVGVSENSFFCQKEGITMISKQQRKKRGSAWFVYVILGVIALIGISMGLFFSSHPSWVGEQPGNADYVHRTLGLLSDLPHMTAELFYDAIENSIVFCVAFFIARKTLRNEHERFDKQHGITHQVEED
jgi:type III secretory pathway component EscT